MADESLPPGMQSEQETAGGKVRVMIEMEQPDPTMDASAMRSELDALGVEWDPNYQVPMHAKREGMATDKQKPPTTIFRANIDKNRINELKSKSRVKRVDLIKPNSIKPFSCPVDWPNPPCDCDSNTARGTIDDVARYLEVDKIWANGHKGQGIVVAVCDGGITAIDRPVKQGETPEIERCIGGHKDDWGCTGIAWGNHGNMCATDVLGIAPEVQLYDLRISDAGAPDEALEAVDWAIQQHRKNGKPHIITNSWGVWNVDHDPVYSTVPDHPTTRKYIEDIDEGILVLFAAGNCGLPCGNSSPDACGNSRGPGKSILATNGIPDVISVGAVNIKEQYVGYSSQGKSIHGENKPDFCSITHFKAYYDDADSGTSAATPIAAGVVALLKQANPSLTQDQVKELLRNTAKDIGPAGQDQYAGFGIIKPKAAYDQMSARKTAATTR